MTSTRSAKIFKEFNVGQTSKDITAAFRERSVLALDAGYSYAWPTVRIPDIKGIKNLYLNYSLPFSLVSVWL